MQKFRKKPVVIEAVQWFPPNDQRHVLVPAVVENPTGDPREAGEYKVKTLEGWLNVSFGDWIIKGVKGEFYPCKPDIFNLTYEIVT